MCFLPYPSGHTEREPSVTSAREVSSYTSLFSLQIFLQDCVLARNNLAVRAVCLQMQSCWLFFLNYLFFFPCCLCFSRKMSLAEQATKSCSAFSIDFLNTNVNPRNAPSGAQSPMVPSQPVSLRRNSSCRRGKC